MCVYILKRKKEGGGGKDRVKEEGNIGAEGQNPQDTHKKNSMSVLLYTSSFLDISVYVLYALSI